MEKNIKVRHNPHSRHKALFKKSFLYNDINSLIQKKNMNLTQEESESKKNLHSLREGLMGSKNKIRKKENDSFYSTANCEWKKKENPSFSVSTHHDLRAPTPKINNLRKENNINYYTPKPQIRLNFKDDFNCKFDRNKKKNDLALSISTEDRPKSRINLRPLYNSKEFDFNKTMSLRELEEKSNTITQLNIEIMNLNSLLNEKDKQIFELSKNMENNISKRYNRTKDFYNKVQEYNDESYYENNNELRSLNYNEIINKNNELREQIKELKSEKERKEKENKIMIKKLIDNDDKLFENKNKILKLIEENKNIRNMNQKLKIDTQKMKKY